MEYPGLSFDGWLRSRWGTFSPGPMSLSGTCYALTRKLLVSKVHPKNEDAFLPQPAGLIDHQDIPPAMALLPSHISWKFTETRPGSMMVDPVTAEFFSSESLESPADALVRETIQNSLDARVGEEPARVRFTLSDKRTSDGLDSPWLVGLGKHLKAERNGLLTPPQPDEPMRHLLIEDFGTKGLTGDPGQWNDVAEEWRDRKNNFFFFWRNIGRSGKEEGSRGSWGLGKSVMPASSRINTFFGISCQEADKNLRLMGLSVLKTHAISGEDSVYEPYGYFGLHDRTANGPMPVQDQDFVTRFCEEFGVTRIGQPGLSICILFPDPKISASALIASGIVQYFFPILAGDLVVEVVGGDTLTSIDASSIISCAHKVQRQISTENRIDFPALRNGLELAAWSIEHRADAVVPLKKHPKRYQPRWEDEIFDIENLDDVTRRFHSGDPVEFSVPVDVARKMGLGQEDTFYVSLRKAPSDQRALVLYLREGLTISGVKSGIAKGLTAFFTADSGRLADFLRDSENPAHTEWREKNPRLSAKYEKHALLLRFVIKSIEKIYERLSSPKEGIDADLLADLFSIEDPVGPEHSIPVPGGRGLRPEQVRIPTLAPSSELCRIRHKGGEIILTGTGKRSTRENQILRARFAYDLRRGNPFKKWSEHDFDLARLAPGFSASGARIQKIDGNELEILVEDSAFEVVIRGLDQERDVKINIQPLS